MIRYAQSSFNSKLPLCHYSLWAFSFHSLRRLIYPWLVFLTRFVLSLPEAILFFTLRPTYSCYIARPTYSCYIPPISNMLQYTNILRVLEWLIKQLQLIYFMWVILVMLYKTELALSPEIVIQYHFNWLESTHLRHIQFIGWKMSVAEIYLLWLAGLLEASRHHDFSYWLCSLTAELACWNNLWKNLASCSWPSFLPQKNAVNNGKKDNRKVNLTNFLHMGCVFSFNCSHVQKLGYVNYS